ncbi:leucine-rich repeat and coiled-coil domain-containing protein 1-like [Nelusetta ayraudi]|uniref:leucine-rich repeat and coiled-coil domain-containing protein 1-like n=1 Tax=Nelusetta ayraudi TaxID=303726 RepID=UPI003F6FFACC
MAHRISVVKLENLIRQQIKQDFPEREKERLEMSQEDKLFMESVSASIKMVDGHYSIALPLKKKDTQFPNNRCVAETVDSVNEERIKKLEEQVYQLIKLTPADKTTSSSSAVVTQQIFKRDTDHTSESECDSGKENRRRSRIPRHRNSLTKKGPAKEIRSRKSDSDPQCSIETSSEATVRTRKKVNIARGAKAVEPVRKFLQRAIGASVDVTSKPKDEAETYRTILEERDQERERRWKAEQAVRKLTDELKCWQTKAGEEKDLQSLALHTTDRLKELLLRERSGRCELKNRVEELEARCRSLTQQVEQARTSEEQHKAALHRLEENISQGESLRAQQQAEEEKRQRELGNKAAVLRRELDIQRAAVRQQKDKLQKLHQLLVSREQEHRKQLDLRLQPDGSDFRQAVAKEVAFMEQKHGQRESKLQEKLAEGKKQYAALEDEFRMALTIEAARFSEVKDVCDQMTEELVGHKAAFTQFQEKENKSASLVQQLTAMVKEQNSRISQLNKAKNDAVTDLKSRFRSLEEELQQDRRASLQLELLKKEKAQLMSQLTAHESVIDGLRAERKIWGQELAHQGVSLAQDRGRLEARIEVLGAELESRKKQSERDGDALKIKAKIVDDQTESIRKLKEALQERDDQLRRMREEATQAQKRFQQQREEDRAQQAEAREQLEHLSLRKEELKQQLVDKDVELEEAKRVHDETIKKWQEKPDFFGPFEIKRGRSIVKRYGVIFTCLNIRAVHLETAHTLNTDSCINAIRRFIARRGEVKVIRSDNGTNFVRAERELREVVQSLNNRQIQTAALNKGITWLFNPPAGSHHGGVWERQIRTVRRILNALLHQQILDDEGLATLLCEVESIINDRPITKASNDPMDLEPLTPNHLLLLKTKPSLPPGVFSADDCYSKRRWRQVQYMADGAVRQVQVRTKISTLCRPITKLVLLLEASDRD